MKRLFIKTGDLIKVLSGEDRGKTGIVMKVFPKTKRVIVQGINVVIKHVKANKEKGVPGKIEKVEAPVPICKLMYFDPKSNKCSRIGWKLGGDGEKHRYLKKGNLLI
ncbi:MAG: 50S ribosomal protein L24 [Cytophagales bacterium]|jgi:large subunit ribosomal protein L24|nr:50S ribosomal protein L24 [Cytophagales bacterium]